MLERVRKDRPAVIRLLLELQSCLPTLSLITRWTACRPESSWPRASGTWPPLWLSATLRSPRPWRRRGRNAARRWRLKWPRDAVWWSTRASWRSRKSCWKKRTSPASCRPLARFTAGFLPSRFSVFNLPALVGVDRAVADVSGFVQGRILQRRCDG